MEIRVSLLLLSLLGVVAYGLTARVPHAALEAGATTLADLTVLEDGLATEPGNVDVARRLASEYLRLEQPALALGVVRAVRPDLVTDPVLTHRLSQAYEALGRLDDAAITASVARVRCLRAIGSTQVGVDVQPSTERCSAGMLVVLEQQEHALLQMLRWGVTDPSSDARARTAHELAARRAHVASVE